MQTIKGCVVLVCVAIPHTLSCFLNFISFFFLFSILIHKHVIIIYYYHCYYKSNNNLFFNKFFLKNNNKHKFSTHTTHTNPKQTKKNKWKIKQKNRNCEIACLMRKIAHIACCNHSSICNKSLHCHNCWPIRVTYGLPCQ